MRRLIPYAGYEPTQVRKRNRRIDPVRALALRAEGHGWREVGVILAEEASQDEDFFPDSVIAAVQRYRKERP